MILFGFQNLGCATLRACHISLLCILGWEKKRARSCECQNFGVMAVCCGAGMMAMKVVLGYASLGVLNYDFLQNPRVIRSNSETGFFKGLKPLNWRMKEKTRGGNICVFLRLEGQGLFPHLPGEGC